MASYELEGTVKVIFDTQTFDSGFSKRELVVTTEDDKFPQDIKLECIKEKADQLESIAVGDRVKVSFDLRGNEFKDRYYVNLQAWRVTKQSGAEAGASPTTDEDRPPLPSDDVAPGDDDFPF